jgi:cysteine desulfurase
MPDQTYFDYCATTPVDDRVLDAMRPYHSGIFANPNSLYSAGREAFAALEAARERVASEIGAVRPDEVILTSGGTEADNSAVRGIARAVRDRSGRNHVVCSSFEHKAVLEAVQALPRDEYEVSFVDPRPDGAVHPDDVASVLRDSTSLVSIMHLNNEIGTVQPLAEIAERVHAAGALMHTDSVQSFGKIPFDAVELGLDAASFSAHKIYGPKGVGALYLRAGTPFSPMLIGGGQEGKRRSSTQNVAGAVALAEAMRLMGEEGVVERTRLAALRDRVIEGVLRIEQTSLNGSRAILGPHVANFSIAGVEGEAMLLQLDASGIAVATGSACSSSSLAPSHVLTALGVPPELAHGSIRISVGRFSTDEDVDRFLDIFPGVIERLRAMSPVFASSSAGE